MGSGQVTSSVSPDFQGMHVTVAGLGVSGVPAAKVLHARGAVVTVVNDGDDARAREQAAELEALGVTVRLGDGATLPEGTELIVTAPGWQPDKPLFQAARAAGVDIWGDVELAWRLRGPEAAPWLAVTGTNGKTTTVQMLASILKAAGLRTAAVGNIGVSLLDAVLGDQEYDVLAVELSSYQLHWAPSLRAHSAAVLNLAPDHLDWHGSMEAYAKDKGRVYEGNRVACVYNVADKLTEELVREADVEEGCRAIGFTLGTPGPSQLGVVDGILVDRAFVENRHKNAQELAEVSDVHPPAPHNIANALAAAALARAFGVPPPPYGTGCGPSRRTPTASRTSPTWTGSRTSTTPRPPTPTPRKPRWRHMSRSYGLRAVWRRARPSTSWSPSRQSGFAVWCSSAPIAPSSGRPSRDTRRKYPSSTSTGPTLGRCPRRSARRGDSPSPETRCCWHPPVPPWTCSPTTTSAVTRSLRPFANSAPDPAACRATLGGTRGTPDVQRRR